MKVSCPALLGGAEGVGQSQVRVADHAEDVGDAPVDHRLHHDVGHGPHPGGFGRQGDVDSVVADLGGVAGRGVGEARRRGAVARRVVVTVPRAAQPPLLDRPLAERPALVGAAVVEGAVTTAEMGEGQRAAPDGHRLDPALGELVELEGLVPGGAGGEGGGRQGGFGNGADGHQR